jgi:hypothetical protein
MILNNRSICSSSSNDDDDDDKVTVNLFLYFIKQHVMKAYGGVEIGG